MFNIQELIKKQVLCWNNIAEHQCLDKESIWYGGFNYAYTHEMTRVIIEGLPMYCNANSPHFKSDSVLRRMTLNSEFLLKYQHESGLISLLDCNIQSPPDTAFMVNDLAMCHFYIKKSGMAELEGIDNNILKFMERSADALAAGGFHTPNHRWVICCALGFLYGIFKFEKLNDRAQELLSEGIDVNADGEWTERSNACYNAVSDLYMYHIGKTFSVPEAIDAVRKNLDMMKFLLHPNDYIVTEYSTRQDKGQIAYMDSRYTITYGLMAAEDNNPEYVYMAERALERTTDFGRILLYFGVYEKEIEAQIPSKPISNEYIRLINKGAVTEVPKQKSMFGDSVLRYRKGGLSVTVMAGQPDFAFLQYKNARVFGMRFTVGWFGMGGKTGDSAILSFMKKWIDYHLDRMDFGLSINTTAPLLGIITLLENGYNDERYENVCGNFADWCVCEAPRADRGAFEHSCTANKYDNQVWADTLFMGCIFLLKWGIYCKNDIYVREAVRQFELHYRFLSDDKTGLIYHGYDCNERQQKGVLWGRGNAWLSVASVEALNLLSKDTEGYDIIYRNFIRHLNGVAEYCSDGGRWHTVLDKNDTYIEASATAAFSYAINRALEIGLIDDKYKALAEKSVEYLAGDVDEEGNVIHGSLGTCVMQDYTKYNDIGIGYSYFTQGLAMMALVYEK